MPVERELDEAEEGVPLITHESNDRAHDQQPPETLEVVNGVQVQQPREEQMEWAGGRVPDRHWKDGFFDCFQYGLCHPSFCMAVSSVFCRACLMGQVMMRLRLNLLADPVPREEGSKTYRRIIYLVLAWFVLVVAGFEGKVVMGSSIFVIVIMTKTRGVIRARGNIPGSVCGDFFLSLFCPILTAAQMARHTGEYEVNYAGWCWDHNGIMLQPAEEINDV